MLYLFVFFTLIAVAFGSVNPGGGANPSDLSSVSRSKQSEVHVEMEVIGSTFVVDDEIDDEDDDDEDQDSDG